MSVYWSSISWSGRLSPGNLAQHRMTHFQCGNEWSECEYANTLPLPYHMLWSKYDAHVAWPYVYMFHICEFYFSSDLLFWVFLIWYLSFFKYRSRHDSNGKCILLEDIQHSQPHMTLYIAEKNLIGVAIMNLI